MELVGRKNQQDIFKHCLSASESKLIALYGRRRIGKTFLVRKYFEGQLRFEVSALHNGDMDDQLLHFAKTLAMIGYGAQLFGQPDSWHEAFQLLEIYIDTLKDKRKKVIFLDELPWFDTPRSKFLMAFENFWNSYCTKRNDIILVICGSAASWMIKKILKNKGGLHNRVSEKIRLQPFNLKETRLFLQSKGIRWSPYDIAQLYLSTGGVPYYLDAVRKGESVVQFVDRACFTKDGILYGEYEELYESLFDDSENHHLIVETLATTKKGLTRNELIKKTGLPSGGTLTKILDELDESGFIETVVPYTLNKTKALYKLVDNFTIFYLKFMTTGVKRLTDNWAKTVTGQSWKSWAGFAFERLCFLHLAEIKKALGLQVIESEISTWSCGSAQIDMIIDRSDRVVNICEIKFSKAEFCIDKSYAKNLRNKLQAFSEVKENKRKNLFLTMITTFGTSDNEYHKELVQSEVVLEDLFI